MKVANKFMAASQSGHTLCRRTQNGGQKKEQTKRRAYIFPKQKGAKLLLVAITDIYKLGLVFKPSPSSAKIKP